MERSLSSFAELPWTFNFVKKFPGDSELQNFTRKVQSVLYSQVTPTQVVKPRLIAWSDALANELGILKPEDPSLSLLNLSGNQVLVGQKPYAARYGGHQFGNWAGQLGDGRAITLGEAVTGAGEREFQLKGAGPTPYSRRADGRAVLRSSVREFLCSEAMHFLGVPTTRALSLVETGDRVVRDLFYDGRPEAEPGAIVCRVAPSFLRFGNFEILASAGENELLLELAEFTIEKHFPEIGRTDENRFSLWLDEVARRTAVMIAHWMRVGFVHGVMNTDNMSVLGLTLDYGPYGWLDNFDPEWTPNTTDAERGRYRYGGQASIALWNLARFAEALFPLIQDEARIQQSLEIYRETFQIEYGEMLAAKMGLPSLESKFNAGLTEDLFQLLTRSETDFTLFFRALCHFKIGMTSADQMKGIEPAFYAPEKMSVELKEAWGAWSSRYDQAIRESGVSDESRAEKMKKANPKYVLRNYLAHNAIKAAEKGDYTLIARLYKVLKTPYDEQASEEDLAQKRPEWARNTPGCSALSCSS